MRLDGLRVLRLAEDLEQVVVRDEVEARERLALRLQVHIERLLDLLELLVHRVERLQQVCSQNEVTVFTQCTSTYSVALYEYEASEQNRIAMYSLDAWRAARSCPCWFWS